MFVTVYYGESLSLAIIFLKHIAILCLTVIYPQEKEVLNEDPKKYN